MDRLNLVKLKLSFLVPDGVKMETYIGIIEKRKFSFVLGIEKTSMKPVG